jgi:hypothetical protein
MPDAKSNARYTELGETLIGFSTSEAQVLCGGVESRSALQV